MRFCDLDPPDEPRCYSCDYPYDDDMVCPCCNEEAPEPDFSDWKEDYYDDGVIY